jgi:hypothetical protein
MISAVVLAAGADRPDRTPQVTLLAAATVWH